MRVRVRAKARIRAVRAAMGWRQRRTRGGVFPAAPQCSGSDPANDQFCRDLMLKCEVCWEQRHPLVVRKTVGSARHDPPIRRIMPPEGVTTRQN